MGLPYSKPFLSIAEQIELLRTRGMKFPDEQKAKCYLTSIGYYRLSGYWYPFRAAKLVQQPDGKIEYQTDDQFRDGVEFDHPLSLYNFDRRLRLLLMDAIERVEVGLRVSIALLIGRRHPLAHRDPKQVHGNFSSKITGRTGMTGHQQWLTRLDELVDKSHEEFALHFKNRYAGDLPIWIVIELWDFGILSWFLDGMRHADRSEIAAGLGLPSPELLTSWIRTLNHVRNICAHHSRLWNRPLVNFPKIPKRGEVPDLDHLGQEIYSQTRVYACAAILQYFLTILNPSGSWASRLGRLISEFPHVPYAKLKHSGFFDGWEQLPLWTAKTDQPPALPDIH